MRYFDGETWWYPCGDVCRDMGITAQTLLNWRRVDVEGVPLVRTLRQNGRTLVPLVDVFYVIDNRKRLMAAGVHLAPEEFREAHARYRRMCQAASLAFAKRRGEEYTSKELDEFVDAHGGLHTIFDESIEHQRTYYGGIHARNRGSHKS